MMDWINHFDLFLFDFDGLLVDTESLHFEAYREMSRRRGYHLPWDIDQFLEVAHLSATGIQHAFQELFPKMFEQESQWEVLYAEKKKIYEELLQQGNLSLLPGVQSLLETLADLNKKRCVVTNSPRTQTEWIKAQLPILQTIPRWFTREMYQRPKPAPDGYLTALRELKAPGDHVIGFEDSLRGYQSLKEAGVSTAVLICPENHPQMRLLSAVSRQLVPIRPRQSPGVEAITQPRELSRRPEGNELTGNSTSSEDRIYASSFEDLKGVLCNEDML